MKNYIISYDISDDDLRKEIFNELKYLGYIHIQKSLFIGINISKDIYIETLNLFFVNNEKSIDYIISEININTIISNNNLLLTEEVIVF